MKKINRTEYAQGIERDLMGAIVTAFKTNRTTEERVVEISREYLTFADEPLVETIVRKFKELGRKFVEIQEIAYTYWAKYLEERRRIAIARTRVYLRNGNLEKALITVKGDTYYV